MIFNHNLQIAYNFNGKAVAGESNGIFMRISGNETNSRFSKYSDCDTAITFLCIFSFPGIFMLR